MDIGSSWDGWEEELAEPKGECKAHCVYEYIGYEKGKGIECENYGA